MKSRIIVALVGVPLVVVLTHLRWADSLLFALLVTMVILVSLNELYRMTKPYGPYAPAGLLTAVAALLLAWGGGIGGLLAGISLSLPLTMFFRSVSVERKEPVAAIAVTLFGVYWVVLAGGLLILLRQAEDGFALVMLVLAGTWISDTGAYFGGRAIGRRKLAPRLSPNKTVEGLIVGIIFGVVAVWFGNLMPQDPVLGQLEALGMGIAIAVAAPLGDLFESMIKRGLDVKDSSRLLGDHGGMLDRIDALLLSGPAAYMAVALAGAL